MSLRVQCRESLTERKGKEEIKFFQSCLRIFPVCKEIVKHFCRTQIEEIASLLELFYQEDLKILADINDYLEPKSFPFSSKKARTLYLANSVLQEVQMLPKEKSIDDLYILDQLEMFKSARYEMLFAEIQKFKNLFSYQKITDNLLAEIPGLRLVNVENELSQNKFFQFFYYNQPFEQTVIHLNFGYNISNRYPTPDEIQKIRKETNLDNPKLCNFSLSYQRLLKKSKKYRKAFYKIALLDKEIDNIFANVIKVFETHKMYDSFLRCKSVNNSSLIDRCWGSGRNQTKLYVSQNYPLNSCILFKMSYADNKIFNVTPEKKYIPVLYNINIDVQDEHHVFTPFVEHKQKLIDYIPKIIKTLNLDKISLRHSDLPLELWRKYCARCRRYTRSITCVVCVQEYVDYSNWSNLPDDESDDYSSDYNEY